MRIEDSFLLDESGLRNLSAAVPKTIDEIEALMRRTANDAVARQIHRGRRGASAALLVALLPGRAARRAVASQLSLEGQQRDGRRVSRRLRSSADEGLLSAQPGLDAAFKDSDLLVEEADLGEMVAPAAQIALLTRGMLPAGPVARQGRLPGDLRAGEPSVSTTSACRSSR